MMDKSLKCSLSHRSEESHLPKDIKIPYKLLRVWVFLGKKVCYIQHIKNGTYMLSSCCYHAMMHVDPYRCLIAIIQRCIWAPLVAIENLGQLSNS